MSQISERGTLCNVLSKMNEHSLFISVRSYLNKELGSFFSYPSVYLSSITNYISGGDDMFLAADTKNRRWNCLEKVPMKKEGPFFCLLCGK